MSEQMPCPPRLSWDEFFFIMSYVVAMRSPDQSTRTGAVVASLDHRVLATGYNGLPRGIAMAEDDPRQQRPLKYLYYEHAERNAIYNATNAGVSLANSKLYTPCLPCCDCARAIIQAGIRQVYIHDSLEDMRFKWPEEQVRTTRELFQATGVELIAMGHLQLPQIVARISGVNYDVLQPRLDGLFEQGEER